MTAGQITGIVVVGGAVLLAGYFVVNSTDQTSEYCSGSTGLPSWTDLVNPICWYSSSANATSNELNTILIILAIVIIAVVGLLAFGPQTGHIARATSALAIV